MSNKLISIWSIDGIKIYRGKQTFSKKVLFQYHFVDLINFFSLHTRLKEAHVSEFNTSAKKVSITF
jgi:hypothetical protein